MSCRPAGTSTISLGLLVESFIFYYLSAYAQQPARGPTMGAVAADVGVVGLAGIKTG